jgi:cytochrome c oxidase subunit 4
MTQATHHDHIIPLWTYLKIGLTLLGLTVITVWVAQYHLGPFNVLVAMIIAAAKGTLVAMYFMHLKYTNKLYATVFVGALVMLAVFIVFTMFDTMTRDQVNAVSGRPIKDQAVIYQHDSAAAGLLVDSTEARPSDSSNVDNGH